MLYVYALVEQNVDRFSMAGLSGSDVIVVECGGVFAALEQVESAPAVSVAALRRHDEVVRALARQTTAAPMRFGVTVASLESLTARRAACSAELDGLWGLIRDREQMTVRLFSSVPVGDAAEQPSVDETGRHGVGVQYLRARSAKTQPLAGAVETLRVSLSDLVIAERVEQRPGRPAMASVFHLVARGRGGEYQERMTGVSLNGATRLMVTGPAPCYAFAEELRL